MIKTTIFVKLSVIFTGILLLMIAISGLMFNRFQSISLSGESYQTISLHHELIADILPPPEYIIESYLIVLQLIHEANDESRIEFLKELHDRKSDFNERARYWSNSNIDNGLKEIVGNEVVSTGRAFFEMVEQELAPALVSQGDTDHKHLIAKKLKGVFHNHRIAIDKLVSQTTLKSKEIDDYAQMSVSKTQKYIFFVISLFCVIAGIVFFIAIIQIRRISKDFKKINKTVYQESVDIARSNGILSDRVLKESATVVETSATLEEITANLNKTVENSQMANDLSITTTTHTQDVVSYHEKTQHAMMEISQSSQKIFDIIRLVEDLAFQTNILAINAAIEAAKAGANGKGFAIVAVEVRDLAKRSAIATKEIKGLVQTSMQKVKQGEELVGMTHEKLANILTNVSDVTRLIQDIYSDAKNEHNALAQINTAVNEIERVIQQNTELAVELTKTSDALADNMEKLSSIISTNFGGEIIEKERGRAFTQPQPVLDLHVSDPDAENMIEEILMKSSNKRENSNDNNLELF